MDHLNQQNSEKHINLLCSQRFFYTKAKKNRNLKLLCSFVLVIISPIIILLIENSAQVLGIIGGTGIVFSFIIDFVENKNIRTAANVQEQYDTEIFGMDWNQILLGAKIPIEIIIDGTRKFKGEKTKMIDWYGNLTGINYPYNILILSTFQFDLGLETEKKVCIWINFRTFFNCRIRCNYWHNKRINTF